MCCYLHKILVYLYVITYTCIGTYYMYTYFLYDFLINLFIKKIEVYSWICLTLKRYNLSEIWMWKFMFKLVQSYIIHDLTLKKHENAKFKPCNRQFFVEKKWLIFRLYIGYLWNFTIVFIFDHNNEDYFFDYHTMRLFYKIY